MSSILGGVLRGLLKTRFVSQGGWAPPRAPPPPISCMLVLNFYNRSITLTESALSQGYWSQLIRGSAGADSSTSSAAAAWRGAAGKCNKNEA